MKKNLLFIIFFFFIFLYMPAQTFKWETASVNSNTIEETIGDITVAFTSSSQDLAIFPFGPGDPNNSDGFGDNVLISAISCTPTEQVTFSFSRAVPISQITMGACSEVPDDFTFSPMGGNNAPVTFSSAGDSEVVALNWTDVTSFTVTSREANAFLFDNLVISNNVVIEDAWVYFTDKLNVSESLANPITILTQEAIDRKTAHGVTIDERDVPVNENYITQLKNTEGVTVMAKSKWFNCVYVRADKSIIDGLANLSFVSSIDFANKALNTGSKVSIREKISRKNNYRKNKFEAKTLFNYGSAAGQIQQLNAQVLHEQDFTGNGMVMAIMDSGFPGVNTIEGFKRIRDAGRLLDGYDFVNRNDDEFASNDDTHGTQTFSDIAGFIDGEFVGTAPDASYYLFLTEDINSEGPHEEAYWVEATERADSLGVDVINTSLGYSNGFDNPAYEYKTSDMDGNTTFISRGANIAFEKGMLLVVSAGNSGSSNWGIVTAPGDASGVLTIGAVDPSGTYVSFSSTGPTADNRVKPDVMARGSEAAVILPNNVVSSSQGTSFSSPIMAGAVTCLWQAFPTMTNAEIMQLIRESGSLYNNPTNQMGYGIPDFQLIIENLSVVENEEQRFNIYPNPIKDRLFVDTAANQYIVKIFTMDGRLVKQQEFNNSANISLQSLTSGLYLIEIDTDNVRQTFKISKK